MAARPDVGQTFDLAGWAARLQSCALAGPQRTAERTARATEQSLAYLATIARQTGQPQIAVTGE